MTIIIRKILLTNLLFFLLVSCGFAPIYSVNKDVNFYIESINFSNSDKELANFIKTNLNNYLLKNNKKNFKIEASINYNKKPISKDSTGNTEEYELSSNSIIKIFNNELNKTFQFKEANIMKNFVDEFEEMQYERSAKKNMARSISSQILMQLSIINAN